MPNPLWILRRNSYRFLFCGRLHSAVPIPKPGLLSQYHRYFSHKNSDVKLASHSPLRSITELDLRNLQAILQEDDLPSKILLTSPVDTNAYLSDWTGQYRVTPEETDIVVVAQPTTVQQVSQIVTYCHDQGIGIVPVGGRTGLVAGAIPYVQRPPTRPPSSSSKETITSLPRPPRELLLSTRRLLRFEVGEETHGCSQGEHKPNSIRFNAMNGILQCGAGHTLQELQDYVKSEFNCMIPLDIGSKGSCCIGGNIATNAGGQYCYRYRSLAASVLGLQVVTGTGEILNCNYLSSNLKDNTGYKLHQLMIGSEGTLGIITGVSIQCQPYLPSRDSMMVVLYFQPDTQEGSWTTRTDAYVMKAILEIVQLAKCHLGEVLAAVEWMDPNTVRCIAQAYPNLKLPSLIQVPEGDAMSSFPHLILVETHGTREEHDQEKRDALLDAFINLKHNSDANASPPSSHMIHNDVKLARSQSDGLYFWSIRESANPATAQLGYTYKYDLSIPNSNFHFIIECMYERLMYFHDRIVITNWGHILDGNLHLNITDVNNFHRDDELLCMIEPYIYEQVIRMGGSISAEHGLGQVKNHYVDLVHSACMIRFMRSIKQVFDPRGILNPGKVLPPLILSNPVEP
jgi:FAD/FMN-containing dehydrogenase